MTAPTAPASTPTPTPSPGSATAPPAPGAPAPAPPRPRLRLIISAPPREGDPRADPPPRPVPRRPPPVPDVDRVRREQARLLAARRRAEIVLRIAVEVLDGRRPLTHLAPFATPPVLRYVAAGVPRARPGSTALRSIRVSLPARAAAEVSAVCAFGPRTRALAARLELDPDGSWRCVSLRVL